MIDRMHDHSYHIRQLLFALETVLTESDDLRRRPWKGSRNRYSGHCYVACEALYHLTDKCLKPCFVQHENQPHWFLIDPSQNIIDPTVKQFRSKPVYKNSRRIGFLTKQPSRRALIMISRIEKELNLK